MKEKIKQLSVFQFFIILLTIIFSIVLIVLVVLRENASAEFEESYQANQKTIQELTDELAQVQESSDTVENATVRLSSAASAGATVATYQNAYQNIDSTVDENAFTKNLEAMDVYLSSSDKDHRGVWYAPTDDTISYKWTFCTTYSFTESSVPVLWICNSSSGDLLAYTTGVYDVETEKFLDMDTSITSLGASYIGTDSIPVE